MSAKKDGAVNSDAMYTIIIFDIHVILFMMMMMIIIIIVILLAAYHTARSYRGVLCWGGRGASRINKSINVATRAPGTFMRDTRLMLTPANNSNKTSLKMSVSDIVMLQKAAIR